MPDAVIVDVVRTAVGTRDGSLSGWHPADLAGVVLAALAERNDLDPTAVDDVILGCVSQVGAQGANIGRNAVLAAGFPESVPGATVDRRDGSAQQALAFGAQAVMAGVHDVVIAGGVEVTSMVPVGATFGFGVGSPFGPAVEARYAAAGGLIPPGLAAELIAEGAALTRHELDAYALSSHRRAATARDEGRFAGEIVPVAARRRDNASGEITAADGLVRDDEGIAVPAADSLAALKPTFATDGVVTAGNSGQIGDGASAALITSERTAARLGLTRRARFHAFALAGADPRLMLTAPAPATAKVLDRAGLALDAIDLVEIHEAFAASVLAWAAEVHPDMDRVNVNGGAIALGHPPGASGTRMLASLLAELERTGGRWGLQTISEAGGLANAMVIECLR